MKSVEGWESPALLLCIFLISRQCCAHTKSLPPSGQIVELRFETLSFFGTQMLLSVGGWRSQVSVCSPQQHSVLPRFCQK